MQVANTLNNTIRILFNPRVEPFKLFDFLIVKSDDDRYIAQIIAIYDDKFDASQNVAKIKLFYKITPNNEVMPYDNFTPNKECEIIKIKQEEIETFINQETETFIFGTNVKSSTSLNIQYNFFNNNAVVLADKVENANNITFNLAKNLSNKKHVVIIDSTGILEYEHAKKIKAAKNFKMPLNYDTIDNVFEKCLQDASLEFQAIGGEIINEIKKFARRQEDKFIPFNILTRVLIQQYKATPYPELKLLLVRLKKYQMDEIFAKTKNEKENLTKTIEKNPITILDLSQVDSFWQKAYIEYIVSDIEEEIYLITRVNDEHFDADLINKIYTEKNNITFVPNVSYNYKKLPTVIQYCKNYILLPSLYQRTDFLDANFALSNLIDDGCIIFGQNTDNFVYLAKDYELNLQDKRKNYRKIALTLVEQDEKAQEKLKNTPRNEEEVKRNKDSEFLIKELSDFESDRQQEIKRVQTEKDEEFIKKENITSQNEKIEDTTPIEDYSSEEIEEVEDVSENEISEEDENIEKFEEIENPKENENKEENKDEEDLVFHNESEEIEIKKDSNDDFQEIDLNNLTSENNSQEESQDEEESEDDKDVFASLTDENEESNEAGEVEETSEIEESSENSEIEETSEDEEAEVFEDLTETEEIENQEESTEPSETEEVEETEQETTLENIDEELYLDTAEENQISLDDENEIENNSIQSEKEIENVEEETISDSNILDADIIEFDAPQNTEEEQTEPIEESSQEVDLSDEELDFFQMAEDSEDEYNDNSEENSENNTSDDSNISNEDDDDIDLNEIADNSIDDSFEEIINAKNKASNQTIKVDEKTNIAADVLTQSKEKENLPIFKDENIKKHISQSYEIGNVIIHKKYGRGTVVKTIKYEDRQLLQIEFEQAGKKLLDPTVADIKLEQ